MKNYAGKECNEELIVELETAGIGVVIHEENRNSEPITNITGKRHGWKFERARYYWVATGPGIPVAVANILNYRLGSVVRIDGHAGGDKISDSRTHITNYHVDTQAGLNALAACIGPS